MDNKWIDRFGELVDNMLLNTSIEMLIKLPKGSMTPWITSSFGQLEDGGKEVMELYILLHALKETINNLIKENITDPDKTEDMVDALLEMVKREIMEGEA